MTQSNWASKRTHTDTVTDTQIVLDTFKYTTLTNGFDQGVSPITPYHTVLVLRQLPRMAHVHARQLFEPPHALVLHVSNTKWYMCTCMCNATYQIRWPHIHAHVLWQHE